MRPIDADVLIKVLEKTFFCVENTAVKKGVAAALKYCNDIISAAPTITEEQKHGRWIKEYQYLYGGEQWANQYCSLCKIHTPQRVCDGLYEFCPHCGETMDGGEENG